MSARRPTGQRFDIVFVGDAADLSLTVADNAVTVEDGCSTRRLVLPFGGQTGMRGHVYSPRRRQFVRLDQTVPTNRNFVLRVGHERTILVHHEQHDCHWPRLQPADVPTWLFLSSVGRDAHE